MRTHNGKPDRDTRNGVGRSLGAAFTTDSPVDPELRNLISQAEGVYIPDSAADQRASNLLERLKRLPWGQSII